MTNDKDDNLIAPAKSESKNGDGNGGIVGWIKNTVRPRRENDTLRNVIEEYIEELDVGDEEASIAAHEKTLISNVLGLRDMTVVDVMIPRADIVSLDISASEKDLLNLLSEKQHRSIVIYRETLDDVVGTVHSKDVLACLAQKDEITIKKLVRDVPIVSPSMPVLDLLLQIRQSKKHMALVIDEYGGIDGLVTIGDVIEAITGEIRDEFEEEDEPQMQEKPDGTIIADARLDLEKFEEKYGQIFDEEEREDNDTIGGLVSSIAGRVPARGEVLKHGSGLVFEVLEADPRRISRLRIKNIPQSLNSD